MHLPKVHMFFSIRSKQLIKYFCSFSKINLFFIEGYLLYRLLFSVKPQHESAIDIYGINV